LKDSIKTIVANGSGGRNWSDDSYARSCKEYLNPTDSKFKYLGEIGDGYYTIKPDAITVMNVLCDMTGKGGGYKPGSTYIATFNSNSQSYIDNYSKIIWREFRFIIPTNINYNTGLPCKTTDKPGFSNNNSGGLGKICDANPSYEVYIPTNFNTLGGMYKNMTSYNSSGSCSYNTSTTNGYGRIFNNTYCAGFGWGHSTGNYSFPGTVQIWVY